MRLRAALVAVPLVTVGVAACGHSTAPPSCPDPTSTATVTEQDFAFDPSCAAVSTGATISVANHGAVSHTFTVKGTDVSVTVASGQTQHVSLSGVAAGTYTVVCTFHPQMVGALQVGGG